MNRELLGHQVGQPIVAQAAAADLDSFLNSAGACGRGLGELLGVVNGFYAFDTALLVRPFSNIMPPIGIVQWNQLGRWKVAYRDAKVDSATFFAEDVFGSQFCIANDLVYGFNSETATFTRMGDSIEEWWTRILDDPAVTTGWLLAQAWALQNGPLPPGYRLAPKVPFVLGGPYAIENLYLSKDEVAMRFNGDIARQLRGIRDGEEIILRVRPE